MEISRPYLQAQSSGTVRSRGSRSSFISLDCSLRIVSAFFFRLNDAESKESLDYLDGLSFESSNSETTTLQDVCFCVRYDSPVLRSAEL